MLLYVPFYIVFFLNLPHTEADTVRNHTDLTYEKFGDLNNQTLEHDIDEVESKNQSESSMGRSPNSTLYKGPLPKLPGVTVSPWVALHSPVKMYIPIRYTDSSSADSPSCVRCPKNLIAFLRKGQGRIQTPIPTISICPRFASKPGRVHVAVVSGPRPGQRLAIGRHLVELVVWKADGPVHSCKYTINVRSKRPRPNLSHKKHLSCIKPEKPINGMVLCVPEDNTSQLLPHGGVCQFFCLHGYFIKNTSTNSTMTICNDGHWSLQKKVNCVAALCQLPSPPEDGSWECEQHDLTQGTVCRVHCNTGYVVPTSSLTVSSILCQPPNWNISNSVNLKCEKSNIPSLTRCHDRHIVVRKNRNTTLLEHQMPKGSTYDGKFLIPVCSLPKGKKLKGGDYQNFCEVTDEELRTKRNCSYRIYVEETSNLEPDPEDCANRTIYINSDNHTSLRPARFLVKLSNPPVTKVFQSNCNISDNIPSGVHPVECIATDPATNNSASCSFFLTVKVLPPKLVEGCNNMTTSLPLPIDLIAPLPVFWNNNNETVPVSCVPAVITKPGTHPVVCKTDDSANCSYYIQVHSDDTFSIAMNASSSNNNSEGSLFTFSNESSVSTDTKNESTFENSTSVSTVIELSTEDPTGNFFTDIFPLSPTADSSNTSASVSKSNTEMVPCEPLQAPKHGNLKCQKSQDSKVCEVVCDPGYGLPGQLVPFSVICNDGTWDFRKDNATAALPDCLAQSEGIAVEVWMSFEALAPQCDEDTENQIENLITTELCPPDTECRKDSVNCTLDEESDTMLMSVRWVAEANFDQEGDDENEVPEAEIRLEAAMDRGKNFLSNGEIPGLTLFRDSFRRGHITLVCPEGLVPDMMAAKCVKCPQEEMNVQCPPCGCPTT